MPPCRRGPCQPPISTCSLPSPPRRWGHHRASGQPAIHAARPLGALVVLGYGLAFYLLSLSLCEIPVGIAYAIWSGLGIVFIAGIGMIVFGQRLDLPAVIGILMILAGILVIQLFSKTNTH